MVRIASIRICLRGFYRLTQSTVRVRLSQKRVQFSRPFFLCIHYRKNRFSDSGGLKMQRFDWNSVSDFSHKTKTFSYDENVKICDNSFRSKNAKKKCLNVNFWCNYPYVTCHQESARTRWKGILYWRRFRERQRTRIRARSATHENNPLHF